MDICIVTKDSVLARFLILELAETGFSAEQREVPDEIARLTICDLDNYAGDIPSGAIGFSYNDTRAGEVDRFLHRPISISALKDTVAEYFAPVHESSISRNLTLEKATRKVKANDATVRLSEKELSLLLKLCEVPMLKREDAAILFGEGESNVVDVYMHYLRKKLKTVCPYDAIKSKRGVGYSLILPVNIV